MKVHFKNLSWSFQYFIFLFLFGNFAKMCLDVGTYFLLNFFKDVTFRTAVILCTIEKERKHWIKLWHVSDIKKHFSFVDVKMKNMSELIIK